MHRLNILTRVPVSVLTVTVMISRRTTPPFHFSLASILHSLEHRSYSSSTAFSPRQQSRLKLQPVTSRPSHIRRSESTAPFAAPTTNTTTSAPATRPTPSRFRRFAATSTLAFIFFALGFGMSAVAAVEAVNGYINPPSDAETLEMFVPPTKEVEVINEHIKNHPLARRLRTIPGMKESRPHLKIPLATRPHNLTGGVLLGKDMIEVPPLIFADNEAELPSLYSISYLGKSLCGHPGIIHGGLLSTLLDEGLARACFPALPNKIGVTASLKIDYRIPCPADRYVVLKAYTTKVEGRKAWVKGWIELLEDDDDGSGAEPKKLVEAEALFIEPRNAAGLAKIYSGQ